MHVRARPLSGILSTLCLCLSACGAPQSATPADDVPVPAEPVGLRPLLPETVEAAGLTGELACSFTARNEMLLLARGNVAAAGPADALVRSDAGPVRLQRPGGFDAMIDGGRFDGSGARVHIALTGPAVAPGESPPRAATLAFERSGTSPWRVAGEWTCGP